MAVRVNVEVEADAPQDIPNVLVDLAERHAPELVPRVKAFKVDGVAFVQSASRVKLEDGSEAKLSFQAGADG